MSWNTIWRLVFSVLAVGLSVWTVVAKEPLLGLDLRGGTQVVMQLSPRGDVEVDEQSANETLEILRKRVDSLGVAEPNLELSGNNQIIIELPGVTDPEEAVATIGRTAQLTFHPVVNLLGTVDPSAAAADPSATETTIAGETTTSVPTDQGTTTTEAALGDVTPAAQSFGQTADESTTTTVAADPNATTTTAAAGSETTDSTLPDQTGELTLADSQGNVLQLGPSALDGAGVGDASANLDPQSSQWIITIEFQGDGSEQWRQLTATAAASAAGTPQRQIAIVLDNEIISNPQVDPSVGARGIEGGSTQITGQFNQEEAQELALLIRGGALPVNVDVAQQSVIGPELGDQAIDDSIQAVIIGGLITLLFILFYYRFLGLFAMIALASYTLLSFAVMVGLQITLTLPGIAGFILAIGMAMDSNILVYERIKEELAAGRQMRAAARLGFRNALSAILDSNATTFLAALTLYFLAVGEVRGFGVTLAVGTAVSIFVTLVILRLLVESILTRNWAAKHPRFLGMNVGAKFRERMNVNPPPLMKWAKYVSAITGLLVIVSIAGFFVKPVNFGIEFSGGRFVEYSTNQPVNVEAARSRIAELGFEDATIQRSGANDTSIRVPELTTEQATQVDDLMNELGGGGADRLRDDTIGPSFSSELRQKAVIGLVVGIGIQLLLMIIRFRWTFGIGAVVGMIHDAILVLGLFVWTGRAFDSVFLAALLTIIAYSVNDSVVIFDRIREQRRRRSGEDFADVVNDANAQTLPRTINISLCTMFILVALLFFGGSTLGDFSLALVVGVAVGLYSSLFIASPITVLLEKWKPSMSARYTSTGRKATAHKVAASARKTPTDPDNLVGQGSDEEVGTRSGPVRPAPRPRKKKRK